MKRIIACALIACLLCAALTSCGVAGNIDYVEVDNWDIKTLYLYSFKEADVDNAIDVPSDGEMPTSNGYIYSNTRLEPGDSITVWQQFKFGESSIKYQNGTTAVVKSVVDKFKVKASVKGDTYVITYYTLEDNLSVTKSSVCEKNSIHEAVKNKIQVTKDRVMIVYDVK